MKNIFVAEPCWRPGMDLPPGMSATHKPLLGERILAQSERPYGNTTLIEAHWPKDYLRSARFPKLYFILKFSTTLQIADYQLHCLPGQGILVPAGIPTTDSKMLGSVPQELLQIMPYRAGVLCWSMRHWKNQINKQCVNEQTCCIPYSQAASYLHKLAEESLQNTRYSQLICTSFLKIILAVLLREMEEFPILNSGQIDRKPIASHKPVNQLIQQLQEYLERNLRGPLSIDTAARYMCMSRTMFTTWFREKTGTSFNPYVQNLRFQAARELLHGSDLGIQHIAAAVGLKPNRMREIFQEREGVSPREYRQLNRKNG